MREKVRKKALALLVGVPQDAAEELLQNTLDRYDEEIGNGRTEKEAYDLALAALGDLDALRTKPRNRTGLRAAAICLYILCVVPVIFFAAIPGAPKTLGIITMFLMLGAATTMLLCSTAWGCCPQGRRRAFAVGLYVVCVLPVLLFPGSALGEALGVCGMFVIAAAATLLLLTSRVTTSQTAADKPKTPEERTALAVRRIWTGAAFTMAAIGFVALSCAGMATLAWLLFPLAGAASRLVDGLTKRNWTQILGSLIWVFVLVIYFKLTKETNAWEVTWLVFPIGSCVNAVLSGIMTLIGGNEK